MTKQLELAEAIGVWIKGNPKRNLSSLCRLSLVSYSSVRRAEQGEAEQSATVVIPIARVVMERVQFRAFVKEYYPSIDESFIDLPAQEADDLLGDFLYSPDHVRLLILASSQGGTDDDEVMRIHGARAKSFFTDLKNANVMEYIRGRWFYKKDINIPSMLLGRQMLAALIQDCDRENDDIKNASSVLLGWENLNSEALVKLAEIKRRHRDELYAFTNDPANKGDILVMYGLVHNVMKGQEGLK